MANRPLPQDMISRIKNVRWGSADAGWLSISFQVAYEQYESLFVTGLSALGIPDQAYVSGLSQNTDYTYRYAGTEPPGFNMAATVLANQVIGESSTEDGGFPYTERYYIFDWSDHVPTDGFAKHIDWLIMPTKAYDGSKGSGEGLQTRKSNTRTILVNLNRARAILAPLAPPGDLILNFSVLTPGDTQGDDDSYRIGMAHVEIVTNPAIFYDNLAWQGIAGFGPRTEEPPPGTPGYKRAFLVAQGDYFFARQNSDVPGQFTANFSYNLTTKQLFMNGELQFGESPTP